MKQAEAYLHKVRQGLKDAPPEDRDRLMKRLTEAVSAYLDEEPEASERDIVKAFGTPEDCAAELLAECDPAKVEAVRRKRRRILYAVIAVLAVLALLLVLLAFRGNTAGTVLPESAAHGSHSGHGFGHH